MKIIHIKEKLQEIGISIDSLNLGNFDYIGEFTAKKMRDKNSDLWKSTGAFFRPNYERGILIYSLIRRYNLTSMLEIGFGRGYSTFCAAMAFYDAGIQGTITTVDPALDQNFLSELQKVFPDSWFKSIKFIKGKSSDVVGTLDQKYDLIYIDGDHSYEGTKNDWLLTKDKYEKFLLFDDYHMTNDDPGIQCNQLINQIDDQSKELIIMDRRIFFDDRRLSDNNINYGQVLLTKDIAKDEW